MPSTITEITSLIDTTFPVPGQDNDTQGFRDNFGNIQIALNRAAEEISDLDIVQIGIANQLSNFTNPTTFRGTEVTTTVINSVTINNSGDITVSGDGRFIGDGSLLSNLSVANVSQISNLTDLTTQNLTVGLVNGNTATVYVSSPPAASTGTVGDKIGMIYATPAYVYVCYNNYVNTTTNIWARVATTGASW
jgi:hypothetical protein